MKIRIQDNSVRFRLSIQEVEQLMHEGKIESVTEIVGQNGGPSVSRFVYGIRVDENADKSRCEIIPGAIWMVLSRMDCQRLNNPSEEGVYLREETEAPDGSIHRFMGMVEKDRPASKCNKPERWIYDHRSGHTVPAGDNTANQKR